MRSLSLLTGLLALALVGTALGNLSDDPLIKDWLDEMHGRNGAPTADSFVTIKNGTIKGATALSTEDHTIYRYLGIPYAKPPVDDLRFEPPQPFDGFGDTVYDATTHPHACPQYLTNLTESDENCLYVSVYSRREGNNTGLLPVVYFVHGGGFSLGQSSYYTGQKLLNDEIVLVTVQYRLGPLGFLNLEDNSVSANNGLKDVVQGLRWVQENIESFGGDPNQVTIMGESAGGASVLYMLISPLAQGMFNKVIAMSGTPIQEWAIDRQPLRSAQRVGELLNCTTEPNSALLACLRQAEWSAIVRAGLGVVLEDFSNFNIIMSGTTPSVEGDVPGAFLPDDPLKLLREGLLPDVPVMLGATQHEGGLPLAGAHYLTLNPQGLLDDPVYIRDHLVGDLFKTWGVNEYKNGGSMSQGAGVAYFPHYSTRKNFTELQYHLMDMLGAIFMKAPILKTADILSRRLPAVYLYSFEHYSERNSLYHLVFALIVPIIGGEKPPMKPGTTHADDLIYMFNLPFVLSAEDIAFSKIYCKIWANFIKTGNPTPETSPDYPAWPMYETQTQQYMRLAYPFETKVDYTQSWRQGMP